MISYAIGLLIGGLAVGGLALLGADKVSEIFAHVGEWCVNIINAAYEAFTELVFHSLKILSEPVDSGVFSDFWNVVNPINRIFCIIASTLMVFLFVYNFATDAWQSRRGDLDVFDILKSVAKLSFAVVLVNNALNIVKGIFTVGAVIAGIAINYGSRQDSTTGNIYADAVSSFMASISGLGGNGILNGGEADNIRYGCCTGLEGFIMFLVFLIASIVLIVCAIIITLEIYERIFKIYVLIPFSSLSFSFFVMGDGNRGNEVFYGYLKSVVSTALEAVIIVICVTCTSYLTAGDTMKNLFPTLTATEPKSVTCSKSYDAVILMNALADNYIDRETAGKMLENNMLSQEAYNFLYGKDGYYTSATRQKYGIPLMDGEPVGINFLLQKEGLFEAFEGDIDSAETKTLVFYPQFSWKSTITLLLRIIFPCLLCAGAVKKVSSFSNAVLGRG